MSLSCSIHRCHDEESSETSPAFHEVDDEDAAGVAAMETAARLGRGAEIARSKEAESSGSGMSQQGGGKL